jgi:hypothetical protein
MALAAVIMAALLGLLPRIEPSFMPQLDELLVTIEEPAPPANELREQPAAPEPEPAAPGTPERSAAAAPSDAASPPVADSVASPPVDLAAERERAVNAYLDGQAAIVSPSPVMAEKRRRLAGQYQPPTRAPPKPIWENAEIDQLGRTVLRDGDCSRVVDDPNVLRQYQFETFDQYLVTCAYYRREPKELPWVAEIRARYPYLRFPDGILPEEDAAAP